MVPYFEQNPSPPESLLELKFRELIFDIAGGAYINFTMEEDETQVKNNYGENYKKLVQIKSKYDDPGNLFPVNQNIRPLVKKTMV